MSPARLRISVASGRGNEVVLNFVGRNEIFGEVSVLDGGPRIADAITVTRCELLMLDRRDFMGVLNEHSGFAVRLLALVSAKLRRRPAHPAIPAHRVRRAMSDARLKCRPARSRDRISPS